MLDNPTVALVVMFIAAPLIGVVSISFVYSHKHYQELGFILAMLLLVPVSVGCVVYAANKFSLIEQIIFVSICLFALGYAVWESADEHLAPIPRALGFGITIESTAVFLGVVGYLLINAFYEHCRYLHANNLGPWQH